jgi:hypothetical protein
MELSMKVKQRQVNPGTLTSQRVKPGHDRKTSLSAMANSLTAWVTGKQTGFPQAAMLLYLQAERQMQGDKSTVSH